MICVKGNCSSFGCTSDSNCKAYVGTQCGTVDSRGYCVAPLNGGGGTPGPTEPRSKSDQNLLSLLLIGVITIGSVVFFTILCLSLVMSGRCSGEPGYKPLQGRGVPALKRLIPPALGGTRHPKGKTPSGSPAVAPTPSQSAMSLSQGRLNSLGQGRPPLDSEASEASMSIVSESVVPESVVSESVVSESAVSDSVVSESVVSESVVSGASTAESSVVKK
ncbi:hypothetical protein ACOMHN_000881 [Nucella lapillus]